MNFLSPSWWWHELISQAWKVKARGTSECVTEIYFVLYGGGRGGGGRACGVVLIEVNVGHQPDHPLQTTGMGRW
jgi:hypothetical protein